mgnify:CR=1 FL=1
MITEHSKPSLFPEQTSDRFDVDEKTTAITRDDTKCAYYWTTTTLHARHHITPRCVCSLHVYFPFQKRRDGEEFLNQEAQKMVFARKFARRNVREMYCLRTLADTFAEKKTELFRKVNFSLLTTAITKTGRTLGISSVQLQG